MSNIQLTSIPESIGALIVLRTLDVSFNRIENIDSAIGKCIRLRSFNFAKNCVDNLPADIGNCILMVSASRRRPIRASSPFVARHEINQSPII
jgi:Leucine-rich repeat (LRR) protein